MACVMIHICHFFVKQVKKKKRGLCYLLLFMQEQAVHEPHV